MRGEAKAFTVHELVDAPACIHSFRQADCPSCIKHMFLYQGRIDGLSEVATMLGQNSAMVDAMYVACAEAKQRNPGWFNFDAVASTASQEPDA